MAAYTSTGFCHRLLGGEAFTSILQDGCIEIRSGDQPVNADAAVTGTLLARITRDGGAWVAGNPNNGLRYVHDGRTVSKQFDHLWIMTGSAAGTAGWFRMLGNASDVGGISTVLPRIDGRIGLIGAIGDYQMFLPSLTIAIASAREINQWYYVMPPFGE